VNQVFDRPNAIEIHHDAAECLCFCWEKSVMILKKTEVLKASIGNMDTISKCILFGPIGFAVRSCTGFPASANIEVDGVSMTAFLASEHQVDNLKIYVNELMGAGPAGQAM
jgi:hypothetical protein